MSVAQTNVQCETCREWGPVESMRTKGLRMDGTLRYKHRIGHGCQARPNFALVDEQAPETTALDVRSEAFDQEFYDEGRGYNLAALWRAKGRHANQGPYDWFRTEEGRAWENTGRDRVLRAQGRAGATWIDDIQAALQYAAYLDPALREDIYDRYVRVKITEAQPRQAPLWQPTEAGLREIVHDEAKRALNAFRDEIDGITVKVSIDRPVDGRVYIAEAPARVLQISTSTEVLRRFNKGWRYFYISQSGRGEDERLAEYKKKAVEGVPGPELRKVVLSDNRKQLESALHKHLPDGVWRVPGKRDEFMASPDASDLLLTLPGYIASVDVPRVRGWAMCLTIFEELA